MDEKCTWTVVSYADCGQCGSCTAIIETDCGNELEMSAIGFLNEETGSIRVPNTYKFCTFCGKQIHAA